MFRYDVLVTQIQTILDGSIGLFWLMFNIQNINIYAERQNLFPAEW